MIRVPIIQPVYTLPSSPSLLRPSWKGDLLSIALLRKKRGRNWKVTGGQEVGKPEPRCFFSAGAHAAGWCPTPAPLRDFLARTRRERARKMQLHDLARNNRDLEHDQEVEAAPPATLTASAALARIRRLQEMFASIGSIQTCALFPDYWWYGREGKRLQPLDSVTVCALPSDQVLVTM